MTQTPPPLELDVMHAADVPAAVCDSAADVVAKALLVRADAILIDRQADLNLTTMQTLPEDQAILRLDANRLLDDEDIAGAPRAVVLALGYAADIMVKAAKSLDVIARRLDATDPASAGFQNDLESFSGQLLEAIDDVTGDDDTPLALIVQHRTTLSAFQHDRLDLDVTRLAEAMRQLTICDPVKKVTDQIDAMQGTINGLNAELAKGATTQIIPALKFGVAVGQAVYGGSSSGKLALGVVLAIKDEALRGVQWVKDMQAKAQEVDEDIDKIADLVGERIGAEQDVVVVSLVSSHLAILSGNVAATVSAIAGIEAGLADFQTTASALSTIVKRPENGGFAGVTAAMMKSWGDLQTRIAALLDFERNQTLDAIETT
jgi:hypothetical protein